MSPPIKSPCVNICVLHPAAQICVGCFRTMDEIMAWGQMSPEARDSLMATLPERAAQLQQRRGGRAARLKDPG